MTTMAYTITIDDREYIHLESIFKEGIEQFKKDYPDMAHHKCLDEQLLDKLKASCKDAIMMSTSSACWSDGEIKLWSPKKE